MPTTPLSAATDPAADPESAATILLATRSATGAKLIGKQLRDAFEIQLAEDAEQAWEQLVGHSGYLLAICELDLALDRFGLLERIRGAGDKRLAAIPVLLLVGENDAEERRELALQQGATDFINLPFASAELVARVRLHTNLYRQHAQASSVCPDPVTAVNLLKQLAQENQFQSRVQQELSFSERHRSPLSLCKLRLDNLRRIVVDFDKSTAITAVQTVARVVQQTMRREDTLCYLGNAEFRILFPATNGIGAVAGINRVLRNVEQCRVEIGGERVPVTLSAAVHSCIADDDTELARIEERLDSGLARAVEAGGNQVVSSSPGGEERPLSIDRALKQIAAGRDVGMANDLAEMMRRLLPLLERADAELQLDLADAFRLMRDKLEVDPEATVSN